MGYRELLQKIPFCEPVLLNFDFSDEHQLHLLRKMLNARTSTQRDINSVADNVFLVGPYSGLQFERVGSGFKVVKEETGCTSDELAWGFCNSKDSDHPVMLRYWIPQEELGGIAGLTREHLLQPGTSVVVPWGSPLIVLAHTEMKTSSFSSFVFKSEKPYLLEEKLEHKRKIVRLKPHPRKKSGIPDRKVEYLKPLLDFRPPKNSARLHSAEPWVQVGPVMDAGLLSNVMAELEGAPWVRRFGPGYVQYSIDLLSWADTGCAPDSIDFLVRKLRSREFGETIGHITGTNWDALLEISAYRLRAGEGISRHSDRTLDGAMPLRINMILSSPDSTEDDFVFYSDEDSVDPIVSFRGIPNTCVCFLMGDETPHEVPAILDDTGGFRTNLVLTYGPGAHKNNTNYSTG